MRMASEDDHRVLTVRYMANPVCVSHKMSKQYGYGRLVVLLGGVGEVKEPGKWRSQANGNQLSKEDILLAAKKYLSDLMNKVKTRSVRGECYPYSRLVLFCIVQFAPLQF